tara:strand:- start:370 stop:579 length:210 start_codon:yes stop_codon:yes gene_type:complete
MKVGDLVQSVSMYDTEQTIPGIIIHIQKTNGVIFLKNSEIANLYTVWFYGDEIHPYWAEEIKVISTLEK